MCKKKELIEWLEANVPDDTEVMVYINDNFGYEPLAKVDMAIGVLYKPEENKVYF